MRRTHDFMILGLPVIILMLLMVLGGNSQSAVAESSPERSGNLAEYDGLLVLYGDPHVHTVISDGDESPDFALRYARDVAKLDWCCLTDHSEYMANDNYVGLDYYRTMPDKYDEPGKFSVLFGWEWTNHLYGHRNVYTTNNMLPMFPSNDERYDEPDEFWEALEPFDVIAVCHHPMAATAMIWYEYTNTDIELGVEFYSKWGLSLRPGNPRPLAESNPANGVYRALGAEGLRFGMMAGSDTHMSRPGATMFESRQVPALEYSQPGITGVWAARHTREAIYDALKNMHCYGMTGTRVNLQFSVNGHIMGSQITATASPVLKFYVSSDVVITEIDLVRIDVNGVTPIKEYYPNAREFSGSYTDYSFAQDEAYSIRVVLENTDMAMATPVWVDKG